MSTRLSTSKECRDVYRQILQGYTHVEEEGFYIKHFKESDLGFIESAYQSCAKKSAEEGLYTVRQKLEFLKEGEFWTEDEEGKYLTQSLAVKDSYDFLHKINDEGQRKNFEEKIIPEQEALLAKIKTERSELLEPTVETFCQKQVNELYVYHALYKGGGLKKPFFSKEEFDDLSFWEVGEMVAKYNKATVRFSDINLKIIAVNSFFLNAFFMSDDDPVKFFGRNILDLTMFQMNIFSRGKFYKSVLTEGKDPPEQYYEDDCTDGLFELAKWYDVAHKQILSDREVQINNQKLASARAGRHH